MSYGGNTSIPVLINTKNTIITANSSIQYKSSVAFTAGATVAFTAGTTTLLNKQHYLTTVLST